MTDNTTKISPTGHYSFTQVAAILGKSTRTIYRWRKIGYLPETKSRFCPKGFILGKHLIRAKEGIC